MEILNEDEKLNKSTEILKCVDCNINLEERYSYCPECKKKLCLNCILNHKNNNCNEKMKIENKLKDVRLDIMNKKIKTLNTNNSDDKKRRNYGIDLLRIYSMINVVFLHSLKFGKILYSNKYSKNYYSAWLLETFSYSAVNTFGMISGYVRINMKFDGFKIIPLWLQFFFYKLIFFIFDIFFFKNLNKVNKRDLVISLFFPAISGKNWYFSSYFCMFFFIPFMNKLILLMNESENKQLCLTIIIIFCILPFILLNNNDPFSIKNGFCPFWLIFLYIIGANLKLFPLQISKIKLILLYFLSIIIPWSIKLISHFLFDYFYKISNYELGIFIEYNSFFFVLNAICLISFFSQLNIQFQLIIKIIELISQLSFGVFIIHRWIIDKFYLKILSLLNNKNYIIMNLKVIVYSLEIVFLSLLIDIIRFLLFKFLKIRELPITVRKIFNLIYKKNY